MLQAMIRKCVEQVAELTCSTCGGCSLDGFNVHQRQRVQELALEVNEARIDNQRLSKHAQKLRMAVQDHAVTEYKPQSDQLVNEELLELKRTVWDLQRESAMLKEAAARQKAGGAVGSGTGRVGAVSVAEYQSLQRQIENLQREHDAAVFQCEQMKRLRQAGIPPSSPLIGGLAQPQFPQQVAQQFKFGPRGQSFSGAHSSSDRQGRHTPCGSMTPLNFAGSGYATPSTSCGDGSAYEDETRRRVQAMQNENQVLRQKVRALASA